MSAHIYKKKFYASTAGRFPNPGDSSMKPYVGPRTTEKAFGTKLPQKGMSMYPHAKIRLRAGTRTMCPLASLLSIEYTVRLRILK